MRDLTHDFIAEGNTQGEILVVGASNAMNIERVAGRSVDDVGANNAIGGIPVVHRVTVPDGVTGNVDVTLQHKEQVIDVHLVKAGGAGGASDTIQVKNGSTAVCGAMSINVADTAIVRAETIDDAASTINAGGTLRVTRTKASAANVACEVYVLCLRVA